MGKMEFQHHPLTKWPREETPKEERLGNMFQSKLPATLKLRTVDIIPPINLEREKPIFTAVGIYQSFVKLMLTRFSQRDPRLYMRTVNLSNQGGSVIPCVEVVPKFLLDEEREQRGWRRR